MLSVPYKVRMNSKWGEETGDDIIWGKWPKRTLATSAKSEGEKPMR